jgi:predicted DNA-binding ribbon-helix-helix protein
MKKISVSLSGHQTSVSLEDEFAAELRRIATEQKKSIAEIINEIDAARQRRTNLSSAVRVWILRRLKKS